VITYSFIEHVVTIRCKSGKKLLPDKFCPANHDPLVVVSSLSLPSLSLLFKKEGRERGDNYQWLMQQIADWPEERH